MEIKPFLLLAGYSIAIVSLAILGGSLPSRLRLSHTRMQCVISFVGGFMLGIGLLHLLPHGIHHAQSIDLVMAATLLGLLFTFFLIRLFHFHQHLADPAEADGTGEACDGHHHHHTPHCSHDVVQPGVHDFGWVGIAFGLAVHTLLDGIALGAAVMADVLHNPETMFAGAGVFLAILLHKPLDAFSITSLMMASGWSGMARNCASLGFALMCPIGAVLFVMQAANLEAYQARLVGATLGFSTGVFLCISLSDLLPELQFHHHDRFKLSAAMLLGVGLAYAIGWLEPKELHTGHGHAQAISATQREAVGGKTGLLQRLSRERTALLDLQAAAEPTQPPRIGVDGDRDGRRDAVDLLVERHRRTRANPQAVE